MLVVCGMVRREVVVNTVEETKGVRGRGNEPECYEGESGGREEDSGDENGNDSEAGVKCSACR